MLSRGPNSKNLTKTEVGVNHTFLETSRNVSENHILKTPHSCLGFFRCAEKSTKPESMKNLGCAYMTILLLLLIIIVITTIMITIIMFTNTHNDNK